MASDPRVKDIKIKTGVVKRLTKEKLYYEKEAKSFEQRVEKLRAENADEYTVRKQEEVYQESRAMVPDCLRRLQTAVEQLENSMKGAADLSAHGDFQAAATAIADANEQLQAA